MIVLGSGPKDARIALIGERPGKEENRRGIPFVGVSGREMDRYLLRAGIDRSTCYVTNLLKDYIEGDPDPTPDEIKAQEHVLLEELREVQPAFIGALGRFSVRYFLGDVAMEAVHGIAFTPPGLNGTAVIPIYHPAGGLYDADIQPFIQDDFLKLGAYASGRLPVRPPTDEHPEPFYVELTDNDAASIRHLVGGVVGVDTEGWEKNPWCLSFSSKPGKGYVIRAHSKHALRAFQQAILDHDSLVIFHNSLYDIGVLRALGIRVPRYTDTIIMSYVLRLEPLGLKPLSFRHLGMKMRAYDDVIAEPSRRLILEYLTAASKIDWGPAPEYVEFKAGDAKVRKPHNLNRRITAILKDVEEKDADPRDRWKKVQPELRKPAEERLGLPPEPTLDDVPLSDAIYYAGRDPDATCRLLKVLPERVTEMELDPILEMDLDIVPMVERMQANGILIDPEYFGRLSTEFQAEMNQASHKIYRMVGKQINPNSPDQVRPLLFNPTSNGGLGLVPTKRTKKGKESTNDKVLNALAAKHPVVPVIMSYREYAKLKDSFAKVLPTKMDEDHRIRCTLRITRVTSGRIAASNPNLMAQPARSELALKIREGFIAPRGRRLAAWDLDQVEMRVMAHESQDKGLMDLFLSGRDIHSTTASQMFGVRLEDVDKVKHRYPAKRVGFGVITGITGHGLLDQMVLAGVYEYDESDCSRFIKEWFKIYPGVLDFMGNARGEAKRYGFVRDMHGRIRYLPGVWSDVTRVREEALRQAHSHIISAGAQGIIKKAMKGIWDLLNDTLWPAGIDAEPLLQIHDELLFEIPEGDDVWGMLDAFVIAQLEGAVKLSVPITAKGGYGPNWATLK